MTGTSLGMSWEIRGSYCAIGFTAFVVSVTCPTVSLSFTQGALRVSWM